MEPTKEDNEQVENSTNETNEPSTSSPNVPTNWWQIRNKLKHPQELTIGDINQEVRTRSKIQPSELKEWQALVSIIEPKKLKKF